MAGSNVENVIATKCGLYDDVANLQITRLRAKGPRPSVELWGFWRDCGFLGDQSTGRPADLSLATTRPRGPMATKRVDFGGQKGLFPGSQLTGMRKMECFNLIAAVAVSIAALTPPCELDSMQVLERCKEVKIQLQGRDPCAGSEFCCALLPVNGPRDVGFVTLPRDGFDLDDLRLFKSYTNLNAVSSRWSLTEAEDRVVQQSVPRGTRLHYHIRMPDGSIKKRRSIRSGYPPPTEDINGDGLVNEDDELYED